MGQVPWESALEDGGHLRNAGYIGCLALVNTPMCVFTSLRRRRADIYRMLSATLYTNLVFSFSFAESRVFIFLVSFHLLKALAFPDLYTRPFAAP